MLRPGPAQSTRLIKIIEKAMDTAKMRSCLTGVAAREFIDFSYQTQTSWTRARRVIGKAECLPKGSNPRLNLPDDYATPQGLYEDTYCARGDMENRIKEQQLDLFADHTSTGTMRANQLRLWFSLVAYVLMRRLRSVALQGSKMTKATCGTIRTKLLKTAVQIKISVRRVVIHLPTACPCQDIFVRAWEALQQMPRRC
ncbi:MAG: transposase [Candidatus Hydrogenedentes bacterium]|nr:transposase [Candidatus Hydrogenedentota bacterium]